MVQKISLSSAVWDSGPTLAPTCETLGQQAARLSGNRQMGAVRLISSERVGAGGCLVAGLDELKKDGGRRRHSKCLAHLLHSPKPWGDRHVR